MNIYRPIYREAGVDRLFDQMCKDVMSAPGVDTGHWQAKKDVPQTATRELLNTLIELPVYSTPGSWASWIKPNLPWAEDHFLERVSRKPLNPPPSHVNWPYNQRSNEDFMQQGEFSHSYPERLWPRYAPIKSGPHVAGYGTPPPADARAQYGIRYQYGDLDCAVDLLLQEPHTRQCYIPLWFPEDLYAAAHQRERVPCTLGYHMVLRENQLHCFYPMRSLDLLRYFKDDAYMAGRLAQWMIAQCQKLSGENSEWHDAVPGMLTMFAVSLHVFERDVPGIHHRLEKTRRVAA